jgi:UDP-GlcNAc:undecaprenyl-phosphate GlcNAc-1-phosphate transferase
VPGYLTVAGAAAIVTFLATFVVRRVAPRIGAIAMPGPRSVHTVPRRWLGGAGMFVGFLVAMASLQLDQFREIFAGIRAARSAARSRGDGRRRRHRRPTRRVATGQDRGQVLSGSILSLLGVTMLYFRAARQLRLRRPVLDLAPLVRSLPWSSWPTRST